MRARNLSTQGIRVAKRNGEKRSKFSKKCSRRQKLKYDFKVSNEILHYRTNN